MSLCAICVIMSKIFPYLKSKKLTLGRFAKAIGKSASYMSEVANFKRTPSLRTAYDIELATKGKIPMEHWILDAPKPETSEHSSSHIANKMATSTEGAENV